MLRGAVSLTVGYGLAVVPNRMKFLLAGPILDAVNPQLPGRPHERVAELAGDGPMVVLDLCAGTGYLGRLIARANPLAGVTALDASPEMLAVGRRRAVREGVSERVSFVHGDAASLPVADASLDLVVAAFGFHELPGIVRDRAICEVVRTLRQTGRLIAVDLDRPPRRARLFGAYLRIFEAPHAREVLAAGMSEALRRGGLEIVDESHGQGGSLLPFQIIQARPAALSIAGVTTDAEPS
jgi:SAM-dependent methyltransferase